LSKANVVFANEYSEPTEHSFSGPKRRLAKVQKNGRFIELGDREKPGAERAAKLIFVYYVPPKRCQAGIPPWGRLKKTEILALLRRHLVIGAKMALIQDAVGAFLARVVFWRSSQEKRLGVDRLTGGRPPMTISARR